MRGRNYSLRSRLQRIRRFWRFVGKPEVMGEANLQAIATTVETSPYHSLTPSRGNCRQSVPRSQLSAKWRTNSEYAKLHAWRSKPAPSLSTI